jgi:hypothetical protein
VADNVVLDAGSGGDTCAADDIGGVKHQRVKIEHGADGSATDVSLASPLPTRSTGATPSTANVSGSASNVTLLASNAARLRAWLYNDSTASCFVKFGATATSSSFTKKMLPQEFFPVEGYTGIIDGIWDSAAGSMRVTELTA